jgi:DNA (cytosine-5)-methyltransferase 1
VRAIDLFGGFGGFTEGANQAGVEVVWAANHWPLAVRTHELNHPDVEHACQDLRQADWTALPAFDLLLASPACQGHSRASQPKRRPFHDALRASAWAVIDCAEMTQPRAIIVENVPSFASWTLFDVWVMALEKLGYVVTTSIVRASHLGVPQRRDRLFVVAARRRIKIEVPSVIEPAFGPSLMEGGSWKRIRDASPGARTRMLRARDRFRVPCLVQHVTGHRGIGLDEPIRTITTQDHWVVVDGDNYRGLSIREYARGMGFADSYRFPEASRTDTITGIGNAVCPPVAREVVGQVAAG